MTTQLRLSLNELSALLKYAFQGLFGHRQDWGALAENVLWLETHGFGGVSMLMSAIERGDVEEFKGGVFDTSEGYAFNFGGSSLVMGLSMLIDLTMAHTRQKGHCQLEINDAKDLEALAAVDAALCRAGLKVQCRANEGVLSCNDGHNDSIEQRDWTEAETFYQTCLSDGILVSRQTYRALNMIADHTLVEATEASRRGAGE